MKLFLPAALLLLAAQASGDEVLYQSAILGPTGITAEELTTQAVPGTNVGRFDFIGARFELMQPVVTNRIGGHLVSLGPAGEFFGALVALAGPDDFPDSSDLSTPDVLGDTLVAIADPSDEVFGEIELALDPGWYGVVFGSGLFGATGRGGAVRNNTDLPAGGLIGWSASSSGDGWFDLVPGIAPTQQYIVVRGFPIPEPTSLVVAALPLLIIYGMTAFPRSPQSFASVDALISHENGVSCGDTNSKETLGL
ncbi:hypothetical protein MalM25_27800 [Planctomycetes bacterium MalM25]|nr:hypothetical protein MalM25_27800 [Planctomycetes bacterium MalM25]